MAASLPEERIHSALSGGNKKLALAESCTGGMIGMRITAIPGSSEYFDSSVVVYSNEAKSRFLGVSNDLLKSHGAVSRECAKAMAEGLIGRTGVDYAGAVTGIAGPDGGTPEKPVGTVWIAWGSEGDIFTELLKLTGNRDKVRRSAATALLERLAELVEA